MDKLTAKPVRARCCPGPADAGGTPPRYEAGHYRERSAVLKALAHPVRLFIVDCLERREHCVGELTAQVGLDQSTVSRHLAVLRSAGIVGDEKRGREIWYSLRIPCVAGFFACIEEALAHSHGTGSGEAAPAGGHGR